MLYRICTESKSGLSSLVAKHFDCFSIFEGAGYWKGIGEKSACIEIAVMPEEMERDVKEKLAVLAAAINLANDQEAVLIQEIPCTSVLFYKRTQDL